VWTPPEIPFFAPSSKNNPSPVEKANHRPAVLAPALLNTGIVRFTDDWMVICGVKRVATLGNVRPWDSDIQKRSGFRTK
jgi:hypothetical protein